MEPHRSPHGSQPPPNQGEDEISRLRREIAERDRALAEQNRVITELRRTSQVAASNGVPQWGQPTQPAFAEHNGYGQQPGVGMGYVANLISNVISPRTGQTQGGSEREANHATSGSDASQGLATPFLTPPPTTTTRSLSPQRLGSRHSRSGGGSGDRANGGGGSNNGSAGSSGSPVTSSVSISSQKKTLAIPTAQVVGLYSAGPPAGLLMMPVGDQPMSDEQLAHYLQHQEEMGAAQAAGRPTGAVAVPVEYYGSYQSAAGGSAGKVPVGPVSGYGTYAPTGVSRDAELAAAMQQEEMMMASFIQRNEELRMQNEPNVIEDPVWGRYSSKPGGCQVTGIPE